jgi:Ser/Thr protein kinase RdoA (MazF antagonist)
MRLGENALYRLADVPVVVRIARTMDYWEDADKEVSVARWLAFHDFPAARLFDVPQPIAASGHPVTFWQYIDGRPGSRGDVGVLGALLRRLHSILAPRDFSLPSMDVLGRVKRRIGLAPVPASDKEFLLTRCEQLCTELLRLQFPLTLTVSHGDAHVKNLMVGGGGTILIDFEGFAWGQPEWDLSMTATEYQTAGWWTDAEYREFAEAYGYDITTWDGFRVLRSTHEIKMTTWIMQNYRESPEIAAEYEKRMRSIRTGRVGGWEPF